MKEIRTETLIKAAPEKVWEVFTAFDRYPGWNTFISSLKGTVTEGSRIKITLTPPGMGKMNISPKILKIKQGEELRWRGSLLIPGIFDGEHIFELADNRDGTVRFTQREIFNGLLVPFFSKMLDKNTKEGFILMNNGLKEKCERAGK